MPDEFETKIPRIRKPKIDHLNRQIAPLAHTPMYNWHKFWSRKTWNAVAEFIKTYSPEGGVVFDPFAGSGVTALEALKNGRKAIVCDILPISTEIIRLTIKPVSLVKLREAYQRVEKKVKKKILNLYTTKCRKCGREFPFTCAIWKQERESGEPIKRECVDIRYIGCPFCHDRREKHTPPNSFDKKILEKIEKKKIKEWYPQQKFYHINGKPFKEKQQYESVDELFTKRNLQALAYLMEAIEEEPNRDLRDFLKISFSSVVHLCTSMCPVRPTRPFSSAWTQQSYWFAPEFMESNVWEKFESGVTGDQGLLRAKEESNKYFGNVRFASKYQEVVNGESDIFIYEGSSSDLMKEMFQEFGENRGCVDYIFTDPPYDASIQYGELAYLWVTWLKKDKKYLEKIAESEVIRNERQGKDFDVYHSLLKGSFKGMFNVLKPDKYLTATFHSPTFKVRNATIRAGVFAGFEFQKVHHQELARPSAKSLMQPFGSAQGDFYLRFYKPESGEMAIKPVVVDEIRFEKVVVETAVKIIAERGEPTPYTIIINAIDPELARQGYFSELHSGLDVKSVLENHLEKEFVLVPVRIGGAEGKLWWFKNPSMIPHLKQVPLSERVEQTVLRKLQERGKVTFTEIWDAVSSEFPNSLTSDSMSIIDALKIYARPVPGGNWMLKPGFNRGEIERIHTWVIAALAEIGKAQGYKIWIGKIEQSHTMVAFLDRTGELKQYLTFKNVKGLKNIQNPDSVEDIDIFWVKDGKVVSMFEVETTTSMTSGLQRGSNLESSVPKFLVIPEEREAQFSQKMKSPMFSERFNSDNWKIIYCGALNEEFLKHRGKTDIKKIVDTKTFRQTKEDDGQHRLDFLSNSKK